MYKSKVKNIFLIIVILSTSLYVSQILLIFLMKQGSKPPIIIWWTPFMAENERILTCFDKYTCLLTKDRNYSKNSNLQAYLFYGSQFEYRDLPLPKNKIWGIFHEESPRNVALFLYQRTFDLFDITATFSRYSTFPLTLQYLENITLITDTQYVVPIEEKNRLLNSISPVLYIQSDCDTPLDRDSYITELMKYIPVDSYGKCLNNKPFPEQLSHLNALDLYNKNLLRFVARYKFTIAFENGICEDYITEKLWRPLMVGSVPIYLGSPSIEDWLPNRNSAILAKTFTSPKKLAQYIIEVNMDDTFYGSFLEHKHGEIKNERLKKTLSRGPFGIKMDQEHPVTGFECFICQTIHEGVMMASSEPVYNCARPTNNWRYFWQSGDCQSKSLVNFLTGNETEDICD